MLVHAVVLVCIQQAAHQQVFACNVQGLPSLYVAREEVCV